MSSPAPPGPQSQLARLADAGLAAYAGTELEFIVFTDSTNRRGPVGTGI